MGITSKNTTKGLENAMKYYFLMFYSHRRANTTAGRKLFANVTLWTETCDA